MTTVFLLKYILKIICSPKSTKMALFVYFWQNKKIKYWLLLSLSLWNDSFILSGEEESKIIRFTRTYNPSKTTIVLLLPLLGGRGKKTGFSQNATTR
jgi:hypothetical protein